MTDTKKTDFYNILRVFAIMTVVIGHATYASWHGDGGKIDLNNSNLSSAYNILINYIGKIGGWIYGFHMPLFFALSGALYSYSKSNKTIDSLISAKTKRLILPYFLVGFFYMFPIKLLSGFYTRKTFFPAAESFIFGGCSGHLWFLIALFWCFIIMFFFEKYICRRCIYMGLLIVFCLMFYNIYLGFSELKIIFAIPELSRAIWYFPFFFAGYFFEDLRKNTTFTKHWILVVFFISLITNIFLIKYHFFANKIIKALIGISLFYSFSMLLAEYKSVINNRLFRVLLNNSMAIYLFHDPLNFIIISLANISNMCSTAVGAFFYCFLRIIGVVFISSIVGIIINRIELRKNKFLFLPIVLFWCVLIIIKRIFF